MPCVCVCFPGSGVPVRGLESCRLFPGKRTAVIRYLCWNSCFSAGERLQPDSWVRGPPFFHAPYFPPPLSAASLSLCPNIGIGTHCHCSALTHSEMFSEAGEDLASPKSRSKAKGAFRFLVTLLGRVFLDAADKLTCPTSVHTSTLTSPCVREGRAWCQPLLIDYSSGWRSSGRARSAAAGARLHAGSSFSFPEGSCLKASAPQSLGDHAASQYYFLHSTSHHPVLLPSLLRGLALACAFLWLLCLSFF